MVAKQKTRKRSNKKPRDEVLRTLRSVPNSTASVPFIEPSSSAITMEEVLERTNMQIALKQVISNKGCPGTDGMKVEELSRYLIKNWADIKAAILSGKYRPGNVLRTYIPKANGSSRALGIPTVLDRLLQQALAQRLTRYYDPLFSPQSFGFRPGRSCHQAITAAKSYVNEGYKVVVDIDLEKFFDQVNHYRLMSRLSQNISDNRVLGLIRDYLRAGILEGGLISTPDKGTPQGGPLSPILSNIVLDELDQELKTRGHRFVRYADDCLIFVKSQRAGERVMNSISKFLQNKLQLKVNDEKSTVGMFYTRTFLGFRLSARQAKINISPEAVKRFKEKIRSLTSRSRMGLENQIRKLSRYLQGWISYFAITEFPREVKSLDQWIRRRLRILHLKRWRKPLTRAKKFSKLGMSTNDCWFLIKTTKRYCYLSNTKAVNYTLNLRYFKGKGLFFMSDYYELKAS